jgi:hypothetical protein
LAYTRDNEQPEWLPGWKVMFVDMVDEKRLADLAKDKTLL